MTVARSKTTGKLSFPETFEIPDFKPQERHQGDRGACVAMAVTSLLEYYYKKKTGSEISFSPQYLYARCKQEDGNNTSGTNIENAFRCVSKYGICVESQLRFNEYENGSEMQITPETLDRLEPMCLGLKYQMLKTSPAPTNIDDYKSILYGENGSAPMPVVFGCLVFLQTGIEGIWLKKPEYDEDALWHAMLIYGWKDTPGLPLEGYFIAQNSWDMGPQLKKYTIHIPYEYVRAYAKSAGTLNLAGTDVRPVAEDAGGSVRTKEETKKKTEPSEAGTQDLSSSSETDVMNEFFDSQRKNLNAQGGSYPHPVMTSHAPFFVRSVNTQLMLNGKRREGYQDVSVDFQKSNKIGALEGKVIIYKIRIKDQKYHRLVSAFLIHRGGLVNAKDINELRKFIDEEYSKGCSTTQHWFYTIGTAGDFARDCNASGVPTIFLCKRRKPGIWIFKTPDDRFNFATREFLRHILPGTGYNKAIRTLIEEWKQDSVPITKSNLQDVLAGEDNSGFKIYDPIIDAALNDLFMSGFPWKKEYAKKKTGNNGSEDEIIPVSWGLPQNAKKSFCWTESFSAVKWRYYILWISVFLLPILSLILLHLLKVRYPVCISAVLTVTGFFLAKAKQKALQTLMFN